MKSLQFYYKGKVEPACSVAIIGSGPVGLAALLTAQFYSPAKLIMVDLDDNRLETAVSLVRLIRLILHTLKKTLKKFMI